MLTVGDRWHSRPVFARKRMMDFCEGSVNQTLGQGGLPLWANSKCPTNQSQRRRCSSLVTALRKEASSSTRYTTAFPKQERSCRNRVTAG
jgi:hypothetical protein